MYIQHIFPQVHVKSPGTIQGTTRRQLRYGVVQSRHEVFFESGARGLGKGVSGVFCMALRPNLDRPSTLIAWGVPLFEVSFVYIEVVGTGQEDNRDDEQFSPSESA